MEADQGLLQGSLPGLAGLGEDSPWAGDEGVLSAAEGLEVSITELLEFGQDVVGVGVEGGANGLVLSLEGLQVLKLGLDDGEGLANLSVLEVGVLLGGPLGELSELDVVLLEEVVELALATESSTEGLSSVLLGLLELEPQGIELGGGKTGSGGERGAVVQAELGLERVESSLEVTEGGGLRGLLLGLVVPEGIELFLDGLLGVTEASVFHLLDGVVDPVNKLLGTLLVVGLGGGVGLSELEELSNTLGCGFSLLARAEHVEVSSDVGHHRALIWLGDVEHIGHVEHLGDIQVSGGDIEG